MAKYLIALLAVLYSVAGYAYDDYEPNFAFINTCGRQGVVNPVYKQAYDPSPNTQFVAAMLTNKCATCHYPGSQVGSSKFRNILDNQELLDKNITSQAGDPKQTLIYQSVTRSVLRMPLGGTPLIAYEISALEKWIEEGSPSFEADIPGGGDAPFVYYGDLIYCMASDLSLNVKDRDAPFIRYLTFGHISDSGQLQQFDRAVAASNKALNSISFEPRLEAPKKVDEFGLVYRVDLRDYGIDENKDWDNILKEYPYAVKYNDDEQFELQELFIEQKTETERAHVHGDWFVELVTKEPFYSNLLGLPGSEQELLKLLGIDEVDQIEDETFRRAGLRSGTSGVAFFNRILERSIVEYNIGPLSYDGYYWKSFDFASDVAASNIFLNPFRAIDLNFVRTNKLFKEDAGETIFSLPNGMQGYYLNDANGKLLAEGDTAVVADFRNGFPVIGSQAGAISLGISCMGCHAGGMNPFQEQLFPAIKNDPNFDSDEFEFARDIFYQDNFELSADITKDSAYFVSAMQTVGLTDVSYTAAATEPTYYSVKDFLNDMDVQEFGGELYLTEQEVRDKCFRAQELCAALGLGDINAGRVSRANFDLFFSQILDEFDLGKQIKFVGGGGIDPPPPPPPPPACAPTRILNASKYKWQAYQLKFAGDFQWGDTLWAEFGKVNYHGVLKGDAQLFIGTGFIYVPQRYFTLKKCKSYKFVTDQYGTKLVEYKP